MAGLAYAITHPGPILPGAIGPLDIGPILPGGIYPLDHGNWTHTMTSLAAAPADQAVLVIMADAASLATLMTTVAFKALLTQGRTLFATPAVGDSLVLTGETAVATLSVAAKPSA